MSILGSLGYDLLLQPCVLIQSQVSGKHHPPGVPGVTLLFPPPNRIQEVTGLSLLSPVGSLHASLSPLPWSGPRHVTGAGAETSGSLPPAVYGKSSGLKVRKSRVKSPSSPGASSSASTQTQGGCEDSQGEACQAPSKSCSLLPVFPLSLPSIYCNIQSSLRICEGEGSRTPCRYLTPRLLKWLAGVKR